MLFRRSVPPGWGDYLVVEFQFGYMIRTPCYKYVLCDDGAYREQLYDLREDPHETRNYGAPAVFAITTASAAR